MITLRDARMEDAGAYECKATSIAGSTTLTATIDIQQPPTITLSPDTQAIEVTEGDELRFSCSATGIPTPSVIIKVPENAAIRVIQPLRDHSALNQYGEATINHPGIQRSHAGLYQCIATNEAGQDLKYIQVNVKEKRGDVGKLMLMFPLRTIDKNGKFI